MIDSSSASDQKSCHGLGFESERESGVQSRQRCHWSLASSLMAYRPQNADRRTEKDVTDFHSCDPQKMSYEQGEACHLHTAPARRGFCAEMSQNQTPCNPIRASSFPKRCHGRVDARTFGTSSARVPRSPKMSRGRSAASPRFSFSQTAPIRFRRKAPTPSAFLCRRLERESCSRSAPRAWARAQNSATNVTIRCNPVQFWATR